MRPHSEACGRCRASGHSSPHHSAYPVPCPAERPAEQHASEQGERTYAQEHGVAEEVEEGHAAPSKISAVIDSSISRCRWRTLSSMPPTASPTAFIWRLRRSSSYLRMRRTTR